MEVWPDLWNVLHDATIEGIEGEVPGTLRLEIECDYLRSRFVEAGGRFFLTLNGCERFSFHPWEEGEVTTSIAAMAGMRLWVLSADLKGDRCCVHCSGPPPMCNGSGTLEVVADGAALALDTGRPVPLEEIAAVSEAYWEE